MSRFKEKSDFNRVNDSYELLPFRFDWFGDEARILTSMVGEYVVLSEEEFRAFVSGNLSRECLSYERLLAKGFLRDDTTPYALDLLAVKLRTKHKHLADFTSLHMIVVTQRCDHSCTYCQVSRQSADKEAYDISPETVRRVVDVVFQSPSSGIKIEFQGGEPLLNFSAVEATVLYAEDLARKQARGVSFVIATNLNQIDQEILRFCKAHDILISTSLDGPKELHDANRPMTGGSSFDSVVRGVELARRYLGRRAISALMTTTEASLPRVRDIIDIYVELGFPGIFLRPLSPYGFAIKTKSYRKYDTTRWLDFYDEGLDYILELNRKGIEFSEFYSSVVLKKILTPFSPGYVDLMTPSGIGISGVIYNHNGDVFASDEGRMRAEMGDMTFLLGNVHRNTYEEIFTSDALLEPLERSFSSSVPMCADCACEPYCGSEPVYHHATQGDFVGFKPLSGFCERNMHVIRRLIGIIEKDSLDARTLRRWSVQ